MSFGKLTKSDLFEVRLEHADQFIGQTQNLIKWTHFFKELIKRKNNVCMFNTPLGYSITTVKRVQSKKNTLLTICSKFIKTKKKESAIIQIYPYKNNTCKVVFIITPPETIQDQKKIKILDNMESELAQLKIILKECHG